MLSRLCASQTKPGKQVGAGASSSASAASQAKDPRRDDVAFASFSAVQSPPLFARLRPVDRAFPRTRVALVSRSARPRVQVEPRETTEWRARRIIRATPRSECSLLFFSHLLQAPLSSSTPSLSCCIHLRRAGCGRSGPQQRLRADTVREIAWRRRGFDEEKGAARGSRPREIGKKEKKSEKRAAETSFPVGRSFDRQSPFFPGRVFFFSLFFPSLFSSTQQKLRSSPIPMLLSLSPAGVQPAPATTRAGNTAAAGARRAALPPRSSSILSTSTSTSTTELPFARRRGVRSSTASAAQARDGTLSVEFSPVVT